MKRIIKLIMGLVTMFSLLVCGSKTNIIKISTDDTTLDITFTENG